MRAVAAPSPRAFDKRHGALGAVGACDRVKAMSLRACLQGLMDKAETPPSKAFARPFFGPRVRPTRRAPPSTHRAAAARGALSRHHSIYRGTQEGPPRRSADPGHNGHQSGRIAHEYTQRLVPQP